MISQQQIDEAIDRIARTQDGHLLYLALQREMMGFLPETVEVGALRENNARRRFCAELIAKMAKGVLESGPGSADALVVFAPRKPVAVTGSGTGRVRQLLAESDPEILAARARADTSVE